MHSIKKKLFFLVTTGLFLTGSIALPAQNFQLFCDMGRWVYPQDCPERPYITTTVELFHPDPWGNTFFFVDMDYTRKGVASAYWQLVRELQFWKPPVSIQLQYDGGLTPLFSFYNSYAIGPRYTYNSEDFTKSISGGVLYKYIQGNPINSHNFQLSMAWYISFGKGMGTFKGYADFWQDPATGKSDFAFLTKPQFWFNFNKLKGCNPNANFSLGSEIRISYNFVVPDKFIIIPTIAAKWTFWE